jgi:methylenetetrahydrofolate dehydrogenase (NADP+) / methenyltetrahydrofolate cyclohydrolase
MYKIIDGKSLAASIKSDLAEKTQKLSEQYGRRPCLAVILVGENQASVTYVKNKEKACEVCGITSEKYNLPDPTSEDEVLSLIDRLNADDTVDGILCQLPLPSHINEKKIINAISPEKDVDGFSPVSVGRLVTGDDGFVSCTPAGILELLKSVDTPISGKHCVVIGRSNIVGKPVSLLMLRENATVTVCHSRTENLADEVRRADIVIAAVGKRKFVTADMIKPGATVIDVGINRDENGKLCGDVDFENVAPLCRAITPVPGGVGPMTVAMLMKNTVRAFEKRNSR